MPPHARLAKNCKYQPAAGGHQRNLPLLEADANAAPPPVHPIAAACGGGSMPDICMRVARRWRYITYHSVIDMIAPMYDAASKYRAPTHHSHETTAAP